MVRPRIRVVNPNSNEDVTRGIDDAVAPLRFAEGPEIMCSTLAEGPFGVETQGETSEQALEENNKAVEKVIAAVKGRGIAAADIATELVSLTPRYSQNGDEVVGYTATNSVRVTIRNLTDTGPVIDAAVDAGANQISGPNLVRSDQSALYRQALRAAVADPPVAEYTPEP